MDMNMPPPEVAKLVVTVGLPATPMLPLGTLQLGDVVRLSPDHRADEIVELREFEAASGQTVLGTLQLRLATFQLPLVLSPSHKLLTHRAVRDGVLPCTFCAQRTRYEYDAAVTRAASVVCGPCDGVHTRTVLAARRLG